MTTTVLHPSVTQLAEESGLAVQQGPDTAVLAETETTYTITRTPDGWQLSRRSRDREPVVEAVSDVVEGVQLVLLVTVGQGWRMTHGLPSVVTTRRGEPAPGATLSQDTERDWSVRWGDGHVVTRTDSISARSVVRMVGHDLQDVVLAYRHPDGLPVFPPVPQPTR